MFEYYKPSDAKILRKCLGLSQQQIADECCVTKQTISNFESSKFVKNVPLAICITIVLDNAIEASDKRDAYNTLFTKLEV